MARTQFREVQVSSSFILLAALLAVIIAIGGGSALYMEHHGHIVSGMSNQIVWGMPHVFAIFLIVAASGALNVASLASVFNSKPLKPESRLSGLLAIAMLMGGLAVLVLDLGRADRLDVAMTHYNFKSIFAWNIFLYTGFLVIVGAYLIVQMTRAWEQHTKKVGLLAFVWRLTLTTGTGSIFGWLFARAAYNSAVMAPLFIAMSLAYGMAVYNLVRQAARPVDDEMIPRMGRLLGMFVAATLYFTAIQHLTNAYAAGRFGVEKFLLWDGGVYPLLFWGVQVVLGGLIPLALVFKPNTGRPCIVMASILVILGGVAQVYVIVIGAQAYPLTLFPGMEVSSAFHDGAVASYSPSWPEIGLGLGGMALALAITMAGLKLLRILPVSKPA
jgi:Ni/Fe-hydrogenase subunit HybB-like protein